MRSLSSGVRGWVGRKLRMACNYRRQVRTLDAGACQVTYVQVVSYSCIGLQFPIQRTTSVTSHQPTMLVLDGVSLRDLGIQYSP